MKSLRILLCTIVAATIASTLLLPAQTANIYNRYGMALVQESGGSYTIKNAEAYVPLIGDPCRLPKALVPYKASVPAYKKAIMETVSSETIIYKKSVTGDDLKGAGIKNPKVVTYKNVTHGIGRSYAGADMYTKTLRLFATTL